MTQDEIIEMAREAGGCEIGYGSTLWVGTQSTEFLEAFAKLIAQRTWVGLTDKERFEIRMHSVQNMGENFQETLCKAIEAKLKQKNGYAEEMNT